MAIDDAKLRDLIGRYASSEAKLCLANAGKTLARRAQEAAEAAQKVAKETSPEANEAWRLVGRAQAFSEAAEYLSTLLRIL